MLEEEVDSAKEESIGMSTRDPTIRLRSIAVESDRNMAASCPTKPAEPSPRARNRAPRLVRLSKPRCAPRDSPRHRQQGRPGVARRCALCSDLAPIEPAAEYRGSEEHSIPECSSCPSGHWRWCSNGPRTAGRTPVAEPVRPKLPRSCFHRRPVRGGTGHLINRIRADLPIWRRGERDQRIRRRRRRRSGRAPSAGRRRARWGRGPGC
jgi:hypothetical protein